MMISVISMILLYIKKRYLFISVKFLLRPLRPTFLFNKKQSPKKRKKTLLTIPLMEESLHHLGCIEPCRQWDKVPTSTGEQHFFHHKFSFLEFEVGGRFSVWSAVGVLALSLQFGRPSKSSGRIKPGGRY